MIEPLFHFKKRYLMRRDTPEYLWDGHPARAGFGNSSSKPRPNAFSKRSSSLSEYPIVLGFRPFKRL